MQTDPMVSAPLRPLDSLEKPAFAAPPGAVDCHMHVFGPADRYPAAAGARYTLPEGSPADYRAVAGRLGLSRVVFVQPSYYADDNRRLLDAMAEYDRPSRGVVFLPERTTSAQVAAWSRAGVCGVRLDFFKNPPETHARLLAEAAAIARDAGWHIELYAAGSAVNALHDRLAALDVDFSVAHMGYMTGSDVEAGFARFLELTRSPRCWVKLTGPYRISPDAARTDDMARRLVEAAPFRLVWGSDWPHVLTPGHDPGALFNSLARWAPNSMRRRDILVTNPERLYGFAPQTG